MEQHLSSASKTVKKKQKKLTTNLMLAEIKEIFARKLQTRVHCNDMRSNNNHRQSTTTNRQC